ncbi:MAG: stage III sporulation protein AE [Lachnospiraceae bacterium]|nr:stage III sporulation protein AE [Lachnospiraceae bacterium]
MSGVGCLLGIVCTGWLSAAVCGNDSAQIGTNVSCVSLCEMEPEVFSMADMAQNNTYISRTLPEEISDDLWDELELDGVDEVVEELLPGGKIKFSDVVIRMITGQTDGIGRVMLNYLKERIGYELLESRGNLVQLLFLAAIGAVFTQLTAGFGSTAVSETGFHITYLMMFGLLMSSFSLVYELVNSTVNSMIRLLQAALPILFVTVAFSGKVTTSVVFSELSTLVITGVEWVNRVLLLPGTKLFLLLTLADNLVPEVLFSKLSGLVKTTVEWGAKTLFGLVIGMNVIKGMCVPIQDTLSSGTMTRILSAIPGIGNSVDSAASLVLGSVKLVRNGIGVAAMLCLVFVGLIPLFKLAAVTLLHYAVAALAEPIADKRLTAAVSGAALAIHLLLKLLLMAMALFFLTIALICSITG